jgi:hypothetical protein
MIGGFAILRKARPALPAARAVAYSPGIDRALTARGDTASEEDTR